MARKHNISHKGERTMDNNVLSPKIKKIARDDIEIKVNYVDSLGNDILPATTIKGHYLDKLEIPWKEVPGYVLSSVNNFQQTFIPNDDGIYLVYSSQLSAPVIVYHRNTDGNLISDPEYLEGKLNQKFDTHPLEEASRFLTKAPKSSTGKFTSEVQEVEYIYNVTPIKTIKIEDNLYIETINNAHVFNEPLSNVPLEKTLPFGTTWKIYRAMKETYNSRIWYNLGGNIWVPNTESVKTTIIKQPSLRKALLNSPLTENANNISYTYSVIDQMNINREVKIMYYADQYITAWKTPYGDMDNHRFHGEQQVYVQKLVQLDNYSVWAKLDDGYYIESKYLNL